MTDHASKQYDLDLGLDPLARARDGRAGGVADPARDRRPHHAATSSLSDEVIEADHKVNAMEVSLDEDCSQLIVRRQPARGDLRMIFAS